MLKESYITLPDFITEEYIKTHKFSDPINTLEYIVLTGKEYGASDIHITGVPYDANTKNNLVHIKFRIDGELDNFIYNLSESTRNNPKSYITMGHFAEWMRGIKNPFEMDYNETQIPQDCAFDFIHKDKDGNKIGETKVRVSTVPIGVDIEGEGEFGFHESLVMRIINDSIDALPTYDDLLIMPMDRIILDEFLRSQKGALITSGPTGSGKSVTLQILLNQIANENIKIHTLEDPIEYRNPLLVQTQINKALGFDWVTGLKALVRQDPDIIMIGEARDEDSAELFIDTSLSGHQAYTTTHSKSGCSAFVRLIHMGVKPYLITGAVSISMSQRLSQKLCPNCRIKISNKTELERLESIFSDKFEEYDFGVFTPEDFCFMVGDFELEQIATFEGIVNNYSIINKKILDENIIDKDIFIREGIALNDKTYFSLKSFFLDNAYKRKTASKGEAICEKCSGNGVKGRIGIFEFIKNTEKISDLILKETPSKVMEAFVRKANILTLDKYGVIRHMQGLIDIEDLQKLL